MFIYVCTDVTQLFFQSVFLLLPNDIKHFLPLLCWCIFCGPKVVQFLVFNRQDKKPPELSVICSNQNMGLCKELEGERGGGVGVVIDFYKTVVTISSVIG